MKDTSKIIWSLEIKDDTSLNDIEKWEWKKEIIEVSKDNVSWILIDWWVKWQSVWDSQNNNKEEEIKVIEEFEIEEIEIEEIVSAVKNRREHTRYESNNILDKYITVEITRIVKNWKETLPIRSKVIDISQWGIKVWTNLNLEEFDIVNLKFNLWINHSFNFKWEFLRNVNDEINWKSCAFKFLSNDKEKMLEFKQVLWSIKHRQVPWYNM
jgi:hypothetical protein